MNGVRLAMAGDLQDSVNAQIGVARGGRTQPVGFIRIAHVQGLAIGIGEYRNRAQAKLPAGPQDSHGDLASVGDQDFLKHGLSPRPNRLAREGTLGRAGRAEEFYHPLVKLRGLLQMGLVATSGNDPQF